MGISPSDIAIEPGKIAAAIDASGALGRPTVKIVIASSFKSAPGEAKQPGEDIEVTVPARIDGSPCLNALADLGIFGRASAAGGAGDALVCAKAYWGDQMVAIAYRDTESLFPPRRAAVRKILAMLDDAA